MAWPVARRAPLAARVQPLGFRSRALHLALALGVWAGSAPFGRLARGAGAQTSVANPATFAKFQHLLPEIRQIAAGPGFGKHMEQVVMSVPGIEERLEMLRQRFRAMAVHYPAIRTDQYHIDILTAQFVAHPDWFDVVVGSNLFGDILSDHVLVQHLFDFRRRRNLRYGFGNLALFVLREDFIAERDALIADIDRRARNEFPDRVLRLSAERTA